MTPDFIKAMNSLISKASTGDVFDMLNVPAMSENLVRTAHAFYKQGDYPQKKLVSLIESNKFIQEICRKKFYPLLKIEMIPITHRRYRGIS